MSQAGVPNITPTINIDRNDAVNLLITALAMEELGLSHIINAEGEKLQYLLGTLPGMTGPPGTVADVLNANATVSRTLDSVMKKQMFIDSQLNAALSTPTLQGATGPTGPTGPGGGLPGPTGATGPPGPAGSTASVPGCNSIYVFSNDTTVTDGTVLALDNLKIQQGTAITLTPPSVTLAPNQTYFYTGGADLTAGQAQLQALLNNSLLDQFTVTDTSVAPFSGLILTSGQSTLTFQATGITNPGASMFIQLQVIKIC